MSIYNNLFVKPSEKINGSSDFTQIANDVTQLYLEDSKFQDFSQDFLNEVVKEMCNLYNEEKLKGKYSRSILYTIEQFLLKKKQNPDNIVKFCLNDKINPTVQIILASCFYYGKWVEKNEYKAFVCYQKSAEMGDDRGTYNVGHCYRYGIGVERDEHKAFIYYHKSAEMGYTGGTYMVGYCYLNGMGVEKDEYKSFIYYRKSAEIELNKDLQ
ncbi:hypothetical protein C2G38_2155598 [Gigaspora rosea]|uniref:HCP-like protein n=1 Tax=Gigaspora rosea TaxID=44941 RepID=A0A397W3N6_9GLOM|nr:hypothetical protein C2G38_2155598 [Gigaspora rosea]